MEWLIDPFLMGFQQRALIGGIITGLMASTVGVWLVLRGMTFFGDAFVHGILPGIAVAILLDLSPMLGAAAAAALMVLAIELVHRQTSLKEDTAIGLLFVGMMALGVVVISTQNTYAGSLTSILFGDALGVSPSDLVTEAVIAVVVVAAALVLYRPFLALSFNPMKAQTLGMRPKAAHALLLVLIAVAVIGSFQSIGTLLVFGLMVGPPATAAILTRTVPQMMVVSMIVATVSVWLGLVLSFHLGTAGSATMAIIPIVGFFVALAVRNALRALRGRPERRPERPATPRPSGAGARPDDAAPPDPSRSKPGAATAARGSGVDLGYAGHVAVRDATFAIPEGAVTAVIGPNGSGKSTLLHALAGVIAPTAGRVEVGDRIADPRSGRVSYVLQSLSVPPGTPITVRETIAMGQWPRLGWWRRAGREDREQLTQAMDRLGVADLAGRHLDELSGGQRQRVLVAQGLVQDHDLLLLDEPLTGLDIVSARLIDDIIHTERDAGRTVVQTTHDLDEARAADHVILLNGEVVAQGPPSVALTPKALIEAYGLGQLHEPGLPVIDDPRHSDTRPMDWGG